MLTIQLDVLKDVLHLCTLTNMRSCALFRDASNIHAPYYLTRKGS